MFSGNFCDGNPWHNLISRLLDDSVCVDAFWVQEAAIDFVKKKKGGDSLDEVCEHNLGEDCGVCRVLPPAPAPAPMQQGGGADEAEQQQEKEEHEEDAAALDSFVEGLLADEGDGIM